MIQQTYDALTQTLTIVFTDEEEKKEHKFPAYGVTVGRTADGDICRFTIEEAKRDWNVETLVTQYKLNGAKANRLRNLKAHISEAFEL